MRFVSSLLALLLLTSSYSLQAVSQKAVTYTFSGGRFGDNLISYMHAKWISYHYGIELLYQPFQYSNQLMIHEVEKLYSTKIRSKYRKLVMLGKGLPVDVSYPSSVLYVLPYFPESAWERENLQGHKGKPWGYFPVNWEDPGFRQELKRVIAPRNPIEKMALPKDRISVAVHIRRGGGFDSEETALGFPLKFPSDSFYIQNLKRLSELLKNSPLYVYLFTDDKNPEEIMGRYQQELKGYDIQFDCRKTKNRHNTNVLEDFFALTQFDCSIHGESNFPVCAAKICDYMIEIYPVTFHLEGRSIIIDQSHVKIRQEKLPEQLRDYSEEILTEKTY